MSKTPKAIIMPGSMRETLRIALPLVLAMGANAINQFIDRIFLARFSDAAIQASLPGGVLSWLFICLLVTAAGYSGTFVAQFHGAGLRREAAAAYGQGLWLTLLCLPLAFASIPLGGFLFRAFGHAPEVIAAETTYYGILQIGGICCVLCAVLSGYFTGRGHTRLVAVATVVGNGANVLLDWMFIFGHGGCGRWGIAGAGWATALAAAVPCLILGIATFFTADLRGLRYLAALRPRPEMILRIIRYGLPSGLHQFLDMATFTVFVLLTGRLDALSFAVSNIIFSINHLSFAPLLGLNQSTSVLVSRHQGARNTVAAVHATRNCLILGLVYVAVFAFVILLASDVLMDLFRGETTQFPREAFHRLGRTLLWILLSWAAFDATTLVISGALKGAGDTKFVLYVILTVALGLWMPAVFLVVHYVPTITALWMTMPFYCGITAAICTGRFLRGRWKNIRLVESKK